ncbi:hypothetical protein K438DRAFT_1775684 [Mycena galopus ATCC 62051]|nr:hypothetical protein K438DRAFT_1775684 [Mycena galopus ATCC 62051]
MFPRTQSSDFDFTENWVIWGIRHIERDGQYVKVGHAKSRNLVGTGSLDIEGDVKSEDMLKIRVKLGDAGHTRLGNATHYPYTLALRAYGCPHKAACETKSLRAAGTDSAAGAILPALLLRSAGCNARRTFCRTLVIPLTPFVALHPHRLAVSPSVAPSPSPPCPIPTHPLFAFLRITVQEPAPPRMMLSLQAPTPPPIKRKPVRPRAPLSVSVSAYAFLEYSFTYPRAHAHFSGFAGVSTSRRSTGSHRQKDRTSRTSVLTPIESVCFRRAVCRVWHYSRPFSADRFDLDELAELGEEGVKLTRRQRPAVLMSYPTDELQQLYTVVRVLRGILEDISDEEEDSRARRPQRRRAYRDREAIEDGITFPLSELDGGAEVSLYKRYYGLPLGIIWAARKVSPQNEDDSGFWMSSFLIQPPWFRLFTIQVVK